ncbi:unknown [Firmicutes bacterium CAG:94]|nr:unknown [Firmicutes bacterium CAG:94]
MHQGDNGGDAGGQAANLAEAQGDVNQQEHRGDGKAHQALLEEPGAHAGLHRAGGKQLEAQVGVGALQGLGHLGLLLGGHGLVAGEGHVHLLAAGGDVLADGDLAVTANAVHNGGLDASGIGLAALYGVEDHRAAGKLDVQLGPDDDAGQNAHHQHHNGNGKVNLSILVKMEAVSFLIHRRAHLQTAIFYAGL